jgi:hypothetical protein
MEYIAFIIIRMTTKGSEPPFILVRPTIVSGHPAYDDVKRQAMSVG